MVRLGDLGQIITGNTPKTTDAENYASKDIAFIKPSDIQENKLTMLSGAEFYISEYAREKARILIPGCILVTCIGIVGKVAINNIECAFNQQINAIAPDTKKCDTKYIAYAIQSQQHRLQDIANAAVVPILNKTQFSDIEVSIYSNKACCFFCSSSDLHSASTIFAKDCFSFRFSPIVTCFCSM